MLEQAIKTTAGIQIGSYVEAEGKALFQLTKEKGMEGIIAKRKDSIYRPGKRFLVPYSPRACLGPVRNSAH